MKNKYNSILHNMVSMGLLFKENEIYLPNDRNAKKSRQYWKL